MDDVVVELGKIILEKSKFYVNTSPKLYDGELSSLISSLEEVFKEEDVVHVGDRLVYFPSGFRSKIFERFLLRYAKAYQCGSDRGDQIIEDLSELVSDAWDRDKNVIQENVLLKGLDKIEGDLRNAHNKNDSC